MTRHVNIPIFIPHLGCPNTCVFCNQRTISGVEAFRVDSVKHIIEENLSSVSRDDVVEIAFFGGSFTGIDRELMIDLLKIASSYISDGRVKSIRCSTRPDYINEEILDILKRYGVKTIELGLQSSDEDVLTVTKRGHGFAEEKRACELVVGYGFDLVGQMMIGLPKSSIETELKTADFIIKSGAIGARIYPTVVFRGTELCSMVSSGEYTALSVEEAIERSALVFEKFVKSKIDVIRIGLCSSDNLLSEKTYFAGPNHPALGELVINEYYYKLIKRKLSELTVSDNDYVEIFVSPGSMSKTVGQKCKNKIRLAENFKIRKLSFKESDQVSEYDVLVQVNNGDK